MELQKLPLSVSAFMTTMQLRTLSKQACAATVACVLLLDAVASEYLLYTFTGIIGAGNYTYYKLTREGDVRLVLTSVKGDADLYISDRVLTPSFQNYGLCSTTCGEDTVDIPAEFHRPVGIGVYGHVFHEESRFKLDVYVSGDSTDYTKTHTHSKQTVQEEESILWSIFVSIIRIVIDILV